jgi:hypothetical protein
MPINHSLPQWNYYRMLEGDLENAFRYIQPSPDHYGVYSDHFSMIILAASAEIENALNSIAHHISYTPKPNGILQYHACVTSRYSLFCDTEFAMPRFNGKFKPWKDWSDTTAPDWWTNGYNKIKHDRLSNPKAPTLERALNSVAALQSLLLHYYRLLIPSVTMPSELEPRLFRLEENVNELNFSGTSWRWELPNERAA